MGSQMPSSTGRNRSNSSSPPLSLSLRLSCDRCRVQKLKCSVSTGSGACERCTRARVSCIFGRRTPSKRTNKRADQTPIRTVPSPVEPPTPPPTSSRATGGAAEAPAATPEIQLEAPIESELALLAAPELEPGSYDAPAAWDSPTLWMHDLSPSSLSGCDGDIPDYYDWLQPTFALDDGNMFEIGKSGLTQWPQLATLTAATSWPTDSIPAVRDTTNSMASDNTRQSLIVLVSEIQQQLRKLEESLWHTDNIYSLDDYPIGSILELSQQFGIIAGFILCSPAPVDGGLEEGINDEDENKKKTSSAAVDAADTPTMLLIMCGYMWLVRTYGIALGHFKTHLNRMPSSHYYGTMSGTHSSLDDILKPSCGNSGSTTPTGPALRLGQLPCADMHLGLQQIHTRRGHATWCPARYRRPPRARGCRGSRHGIDFAAKRGQTSG